MRFFLICLCAAQLFCAFTLVCDYIFMLSCFVVLLSCHVFFVVLPVSFAVISPFCPFSVSSYLLTFSRLVLAWPRLFLIYHMMSYFALVDIGCLFALLFRSVSFQSFCRSLLLSRFSALRVSPAETRLTVYRRLTMTRRAEGVQVDE